MLAALACNSLVSCGTDHQAAVPKPVDEISDAAADGDLGKVKALLKPNPDLVFSKDYNGMTPLHYAATEGHKDVVELLLASKSDVNAKNKLGATPLFLAAVKGHKDVVELLLVKGAEVNVRDNNGDTPLDWAAKAGHKDIVELLRGHGGLSTAANVMKQFSYPKLGFKIRFPASWVVRDKSGDLAGGYWVEGRRSADTPSGLDQSKPTISKAEQQRADIAFLRGIRVTILVQDIDDLERTSQLRLSLQQAVNNRIQGMKLMKGTDVDVKPLEQVEVATVPAFVTRYTERYDKGDAATISTTTILRLVLAVM